MKGALIEREIFRVFVICVPIIVETHQSFWFQLEDHRKCSGSQRGLENEPSEKLMLGTSAAQVLESCNFLSWTHNNDWNSYQKNHAYYNSKGRVHRFFAWPNFNQPSQMLVQRLLSPGFLAIQQKEANITNKNGLCFLLSYLSIFLPVSPFSFNQESFCTVYQT